MQLIKPISKWFIRGTTDHLELSIPLYIDITCTRNPSSAWLNLIPMTLKLVQPVM